MSGHSCVVALVVLVLAMSHLSSVSAIAMLCSSNAPPAAPRNVRIQSQRWDSGRGRVVVVFAFDNPTTERTGCITMSTVGIVDARNQQLGAKVPVSSPTLSPITFTSFLQPNNQYTLQFAETETAASKKARTNVNLRFVTMKAPAPVPKPPTPTPVCSTSAAPVVPQKIRIDSQEFDTSNGRTRVTITWDNPTTSATGCITWYTISITDAKGSEVGSKRSLVNPLTNPVKTVQHLVPGQRYTINHIETETAAGRKARSTPNLTFITNGMTAVPLATAASG